MIGDKILLFGRPDAIAIESKILATMREQGGQSNAYDLKRKFDPNARVTGNVVDDVLRDEISNALYSTVSTWVNFGDQDFEGRVNMIDAMAIVLEIKMIKPLEPRLKI